MVKKRIVDPYFKDKGHFLLPCSIKTEDIRTVIDWICT